MRIHRWWLVGLGAVLAMTGPSPGADPPAPAAARDVEALTARIDQLLAARWAAAGVRPAPPADDAEFLRRVYLDLAGKIPAVSEVRAFLDDPAPDKRRRAVERLLRNPAYVRNLVNVWRALLLPEVRTNDQVRALAPGFEAWLRRQIAANTGYDRMVRAIITAKVGADGGPSMDSDGRPGDPTPAAFYVAKDARPENLAASTARLFLGVRLECAQCHDHPTARWKRQQFWSYAAFFAGLQKPERADDPSSVREVRDRRELEIPGTNQVVQATFPDGTEPRWKFGVGSRQTLAEWMTAADNPFFARAAVNRTWAHFFGIGLVEPVDDLIPENRPSHPVLLDDLARQFADHQFDLKFLIRAITASRAYQLSSTATDPGQDNPRLFARMAVKGLTPEQLFDSIVQATGYREPPRSPGPLVRTGNPPRDEFLAKFATQNDQPTEAHTSILQVLSLMNGKFITDATRLDRSEMLATVIDAPFFDTAGRIETLYLATLSRKPRPDESARLVRYVTRGGPKGDPRAALADVFWALLNSAEFMLNH